MQITLKAARIMRDMRQTDVAQAIGMDRTCYSDLEKHPERARIQMVHKICEVLGFEPDDIIGFAPNSTTP